jgi:membrane-associated phospholipid phosphatase
MLLVYGKVGSFILLNRYHSLWLNTIFTYYTHLGDGLFSLCVIAILIFYYKKRDTALAFLYGYLISGFIVQALKKIAVSPRPKMFFEPGQYAYFIEGVTHAGNTSFPSGHTASAFALVTIASILIKNKKTQLVLLLLAIFEGYSRIYLAQHFLLDVIIGCFIGSISAFPSIYLAENTKYLKKYFQKTFKITPPPPEFASDVQIT